MIHIVGLGIGDISNLSKTAINAIQSCHIVIGSTRQHKIIHTLLPDNSTLLPYPSPLKQLEPLLDQHKNKNILILASGDPLFFGIGAWLVKHSVQNQLSFHPNISSIQIAFSHIKQPWQQANIVSLHGRPLNSLRPTLRNHQWYALLTDKNSQPHHIAQELHQHGFEQSQLWVCEALGTDDEKIQHYHCVDLLHNTHTFHPLHITLVHTKGKGNILPEFPGIADELFETGSLPGKGMITKKQIRLSILSLLQTRTEDIGWDIGAGCGGLSVEWAYWHPQTHIYAIEHHEHRLKYLHINKEKFGVTQNLSIIAGTAPLSSLDNLPSPNKIFIGGSGGLMESILEYSWKRLQANGCIVISCITEECKYEIMTFIKMHQLKTVEQLEVSVSKSITLADKQLLQPQIPVRLIKITKEIE